MTSQAYADLKTRLEAMFGSLKAQGAAQALPAPLSLSNRLYGVLKKCRKDQRSTYVDTEIAKLFATAGVEMWQRGVHSFLISASLTDASPVWASVSGYYASHYCVRGLAHLLGHFQVYRDVHKAVCLELHGGRYVCSLKRSASEHQFYWKMVKRDPCFAGDPLFTENENATAGIRRRGKPNLVAEKVIDESDAGHRNHANYGDHVNRFPQFRVLDEQVMKNRVHFISQIQVSAPPIPSRDLWPDLESVQVVAYQRIVTFRRFLDNLLGGGNRFWTVHRSPPWTAGILDFQLTEQAGLGSDRLGQALGR